MPECVPQIWSILVLFGEGIKTKKPAKSTFDGLLIILVCEPADRTGLEPATSAVTGRHSNQLNYRSNLKRLLATSSPLANAPKGVAKIEEFSFRQKEI